MNPIDELKQEHRAIEGALEILESIARRVPQAEAVADARQLVAFFRTFADTCHHGKEEQVLFPTLEELGVSRQNGPIGVMLAEHDQGRKHIQGMLDALEAAAAGGQMPADQFRDHACGYARLLRQHIEKEDSVLFVIAARLLSPADKARLDQEFLRIEQDVVGEGRHEELHRLLDAFGKKYPSEK